MQVGNIPLNDTKYFDKIISKNRKQHEITTTLHLPHLITQKEDVKIFPLLLSRPNFITRKSVSGKIIILKDDENIIKKVDNKIVVTERADPGFDWIFSKNIKGLITKYGGSNSHMSIRCAEFQIPAAIGCGEQIFDRIMNSERVEIDCLTGVVQPLV